MIEFFGELSDECKMETAKRRAKNAGFVFLFGTMLASFVTIILAVLKHSEFYYFLGITIVIAILNIIIFKPPSTKRVLGFSIPIKICISHDNITQIAYQVAEIKKTKSFSKLKRVIDVGDWYYLIFRFGDISNSWVCQKSLITKGTIEEFEKLFVDKIRKIK